MHTCTERVAGNVVGRRVSHDARDANASADDRLLVKMNAIVRGALPRVTLSRTCSCSRFLSLATGTVVPEFKVITDDRIV